MKGIYGEAVSVTADAHFDLKPHQCSARERMMGRWKMRINKDMQNAINNKC